MTTLLAIFFLVMAINFVWMVFVFLRIQHSDYQADKRIRQATKDRGEGDLGWEASRRER